MAVVLDAERDEFGRVPSMPTEERLGAAVARSHDRQSCGRYGLPPEQRGEVDGSAGRVAGQRQEHPPYTVG